MYNDKATTTAIKGVKPLAPMHSLTTCTVEPPLYGQSGFRVCR